ISPTSNLIVVEILQAIRINRLSECQKKAILAGLNFEDFKCAAIRIPAESLQAEAASKMVPVAVGSNAANVKATIGSPDEAVDPRLQSLAETEHSSLVNAIHVFQEDSLKS